MKKQKVGGFHRMVHFLVSYFDDWRTERKINSWDGKKIIGLSKRYGYELLRDQCTPKRLVFGKEHSTVYWE